MKFIIVDGDMVIFLPNFGSAVVVPIPTTIAGSASKTKVTGKAVCLEGDEKDVQSPGCAYISGAFVVPGVGTLKIDALSSDQLTSSTKVEGKLVILQGTKFSAKFEVQAPAVNPVSGATDPVSSYPGGSGTLMPSNFKVEAQ